MYYNVLKAKDLVEHQQFVRKELMRNDNGCLSVIGLEKNQIIDTHTSTADSAVFVLDGEIEMHFDAEKFNVSKGEILMFKKDKEHKVLALKDSKFFLIKI